MPAGPRHPPEAPSPRVRRTGLHSRVVRDLGLRIVRGDVPIGSTLPRAEALAAELGVSRSVVREGIRVLADKGLLEARQRSGTRVRERAAWNLVDPDLLRWQRESGPDLQFLRDLSEVRQTIEVTAARLAAERATAAEVERMRVHLGRMADTVDERDDYIRADLALHATILHATHNALLAQLTHTVAEGLVASRDVTVRADGTMLEALVVHEALVDAIAARDRERAATEMTALVQRARADIEMLLAPGSVAPGSCAHPSDAVG